ncbi:MAG: hypothetical protein QOI81_57 [Actinomycetota bacterium]|nr:hypothetical protein [Actinomycetota bacterium]
MFCTALKVFSPKLGYLSGPWANLHGGGLILQGVGGGVETGPRYEGELRRAAKLYAAAGDAKAAKAIDGLADHFAAMVASARAIFHTGAGANKGANFHQAKRELESTGTALVDYERSHRPDLPRC